MDASVSANNAGSSQGASPAGAEIESYFRRRRFLNPLTNLPATRGGRSSYISGLPWLVRQNLDLSKEQCETLYDIRKAIRKNHQDWEAKMATGSRINAVPWQETPKFEFAATLDLTYYYIPSYEYYAEKGFPNLHSVLISKYPFYYDDAQVTAAMATANLPPLPYGPIYLPGESGQSDQRGRGQSRITRTMLRRRNNGTSGQVTPQSATVRGVYQSNQHRGKLDSPSQYRTQSSPVRGAASPPEQGDIVMDMSMTKSQVPGAENPPWVTADAGPFRQQEEYMDFDIDFSLTDMEMEEFMMKHSSQDAGHFAQQEADIKWENGFDLTGLCMDVNMIDPALLALAAADD